MAEHYIPAAALPRHPYMRFVWGLLALLLIMTAGSIGYKIIGGEKATWIDCIYMTFITVATIGYGEIIDLNNSPGGRVFTMIIGFAGIGAGFAQLFDVAHFVTARDDAGRRIELPRRNRNQQIAPVVAGDGKHADRGFHMRLEQNVIIGGIAVDIQRIRMFLEVILDFMHIRVDHHI